MWYFLRRLAGAAFVVAAGIAAGSCARFPEFRPVPWTSQSPDGLRALDTLAVAGRVLAIVGGVRYRARWGLVASAHALRLQVFSGEGGLLADIALRGERMTLFLPPRMECHEGAARTVPVDSLLEIPVPWEAGLVALHATLWPRALPPPWTPGMLGSRRGWYFEATRVFLEPDPAAALPRFLALWRGDALLTLQVRGWARTPVGEVPSELLFSMPAHDLRMWVDLSVRKTEGFDGAWLEVTCPGGASSRVW